MTTLYGIRNCDSCRKAGKWLEQNGIPHRYVDIREDELDSKLVRAWLDSVGCDQLINRRSKTWRSIPETERESLNPKTACGLIKKYPTVMKRPALDTGKQLILGFDEMVYAGLGLK